MVSLKVYGEVTVAQIISLRIGIRAFSYHKLLIVSI